MYTSKNMAALSNCSLPLMPPGWMSFLCIIFGWTGTQPENGLNFFQCLNI